MGIVTTIDQERRLRIPEQWGDEFAPKQSVELERCEQGVLVKPLGKTPLQAALQRKVRMNQPACLDLADVDMDAMGW